MTRRRVAVTSRAATMLKNSGINFLRPSALKEDEGAQEAWTVRKVGRQLDLRESRLLKG